MSRFNGSTRVVLAVIVSALAYGTGNAASATLQNASFDTYIAESDSFPFWKADRDATGGTAFAISQETDGAFSVPGCLKMEIKEGADTLTECRISGAVSNLPANKIFTVTAMVKYTGMPGYWNAMLNTQQATLLRQEPWTWTDRKWSSMWGNNPGDAAWTPVSVSDTTHDSTNVVNFIISLSKAGTLWVDDVAITYTDVSVVRQAVRQTREGSIQNNRLVFSTATPYTLEICSVNGKTILKTSGVTNNLNLYHRGLSNGAYIAKVKTKDKIYTRRVVIDR